MFIGEIARGEFPHHAEYFARGLKRACGPVLGTLARAVQPIRT
jgi:hypothetical protein